MSAYDERIWLSQYSPRLRQDHDARTIEFDTIVSMLKATVDRAPESDIIRYFDKAISARELDRLSDAFAAGIIDSGFAPGDRAVIYLQNIPQFVIAQLGTWKAGGVVVCANPMYRARELNEVLVDSGATILVTLESLYRDVAEDAIAETSVHTVVTTSELEYQSANSGTLAGLTRIDCAHTVDMTTMLTRWAGSTPPQADIGPTTVALLTYTSGTTGPPKGAMITHRNFVFNSQTYRDWIGVGADDVILGVAPLFHVTGLIAHIGLSLLTGAPLILMYRLDPAATVAIVEAQQATFTIGSITVFIAWLNAASATPDALRSLTKIYSGGAPIPPSTITAFEEKFGHYIHNIYGLTETTSPSHAVPLGAKAPIDPNTGATSVGVPVFDTVVRIIDDHGVELPPGEIGELTVAGPQVVAGYWNKPEATAEAMPNGVLRTGDVGFMDDKGWFYIVDRKKDQINASGFKVWPREVEDALYEHDAIREAAVIGVPDDYRGETVKAFVSLRPGMTVTPEDLIAFTKERLATYKCPRIIRIIPDIPKTATGKFLRRNLRDQP